MGRWEPNARERLAAAALQLYAEQGYEQTTVAQIARQAGLTERTFFRHYADKREVLFAGSPLQELFVAAVVQAPASAPLLDVLGAGLDAAAEMFAGRHEYALRRQAVVAAHPELQERELIKLASLAAALAEALRGRGVPEPTATLTAEAGVAVFKVGFERWLAAAEETDMAPLTRELLDELGRVTARS
ncbi:helix-turn-helix domain-containing protein [Streptomyces sp. NPDC048279]|jgi:AcrR family transcriptional regulator|uniref:TetR/AcrR family transcriptional regulator n=1 Tax=Streptomyces sp. NPDC048279 TaxID=3154714 RepID=UPI0034161631